MQKNSAVVATFTYDADGKRVKSVMGTDTILFVGTHYEVKNGNQITQYYLAGTTRVAMRKYTIPQNMSVEYLLSDHLGSTSLTTDVNGAKVLELRYKAWGEVRATWTANPTTTPAYRSPAYTYTGQYSYMDDPTTSGTAEGFGLMFYNARWYDPALGRFAQADSIIPEQTQGAQAWDHYAYVNNNPVNASDPTGHLCEDEDVNGHCPGYVPPSGPTSRTPAPTSTPDPSAIVAVPAPVVAPPVSAYTEDIGVTNIFPNSYHFTFPAVISFGPSNAYSSGAPVNIGNDELDLELPFNISLNGPANIKVDAGDIRFQYAVPVMLTAYKELQSDGTYKTTNIYSTPIHQAWETEGYITPISARAPDKVISGSIPSGTFGPFSWNGFRFSWP